MNSWIAPTAGPASGTDTGSRTAMSAVSTTTSPIALLLRERSTRPTFTRPMPRSNSTNSACSAMTSVSFLPTNAYGFTVPILKARSPAAFAALTRLEGRITELEMAGMNARAKIDKVPEDQVAADFLADEARDQGQRHLRDVRRASSLRRLGEHLVLVSISLAVAILVVDPARHHRGPTA